MTTIEAVAGYVPTTSVTVADCLRPYGFSESRIRMHEKFFGFGTVPQDPDSSLADHLVASVEALPDFPQVKQRVRYVVHARSLPVVAPPGRNPLAEACARLGLSSATAFSLTQHACASGLLALDLAGRVLRRDDDGLVLLLVGEKAFTEAARVIANTSVMGEGSAAVLVGSGPGRNQVLSYATHTEGKFHGGAWMSEERAAEFQDEYPAHVVDVITRALDGAGMTIDDVALILPHNVNRMSWARILRRLGMSAPDRLFLDNLGTQGHCFGADAFVNYAAAAAAGRLRRGDRYLMTAVGLGATYSAVVLEH